MAPLRRGGLLGLFVGMLVLATVIVSLRLYARHRRNMHWSTGDAMMVFAWVLAVTICVSTGIGCFYGGYGYATNQLTEEVWIEGMKQLYVYQVLYNPAMTAIRLSILLFYIQINPFRHFRILVYSTMGFCVASCIVATLCFVFRCQPISDAWAPIDHGCMDTQALFMSTMIINLLTDVWVLVIPLPMVWRLQMPTRQKVALMATFAVGFLTCIAAGIRIRYIRRAFTPDPLYDAVSAGIWSYIEIVTGITCASLPALRALFHIPGGKGGGGGRQSTLSFSGGSSREKRGGGGGGGGGGSSIFTTKRTGSEDTEVETKAEAGDEDANGIDARMEMDMDMESLQKR